MPEQMNELRQDAKDYISDATSMMDVHEVIGDEFQGKISHQELEVIMDRILNDYLNYVEGIRHHG